MKLKIISDGTNAGTKLIDEDSGQSIPLIQKLAWEARATEGFGLTRVTVELLNVPVEIVSKADVDSVTAWPEESVSSFEKEVRIVSEISKGTGPVTKIFDNQTQEQIGAIQEIKWEANLDERKAKIKKIKFDKKDWVKK